MCPKHVEAQLFALWQLWNAGCWQQPKHCPTVMEVILSEQSYKADYVQAKELERAVDWRKQRLLPSSSGLRTSEHYGRTWKTGGKKEKKNKMSSNNGHHNGLWKQLRNMGSSLWKDFHKDLRPKRWVWVGMKRDSFTFTISQAFKEAENAVKTLLCSYIAPDVWGRVKSRPQPEMNS